MPAGLRIRVATTIPSARRDQVRIVPHATHYTLEVIDEHAVVPADVDPRWGAGLDLGVKSGSIESLVEQRHTDRLPSYPAGRHVGPKRRHQHCDRNEHSESQPVDSHLKVGKSSLTIHQRF